jgi:hypothetical protein
MFRCFSLAQGFDVLHGEIISVDKDGPADLAGLKVSAKLELSMLRRVYTTLGGNYVLSFFSIFFSGSSHRYRAVRLHTIANFLLERAFNLCATLRLLFDCITNTYPRPSLLFKFCATLRLSG